MLRLPSSAAPDPRRRFNAIISEARAPETAAEKALYHLLAPSKVPLKSVDPEVLAGVRAACVSYETPTVRALFDACLLGRATAEELQAAFGVSLAEARAYAELFFDRAVFQNDFHVIAFIRSVTDDAARELLKEGFTKGFRALRHQYASDVEPPTAETTLQRIFEADAQLYMQHRTTPLTSKAVKEVRALGKYVVGVAQVMGKVAPPKQERQDGDTDFVIENGPANPTLEELLEKGVELAN